MTVRRLTGLLICLSLLAPSGAAPLGAAVSDLDLTFAGFGEAGQVLTDLGGGSEGAYAAALQPDGKIVVAGTMNGALVVARYQEDGGLDAAFGGGDGYTRTPIGGISRAYGVALQGDGAIVVAGYVNSGGSNDFVVARYDAAGALDPSFGGGTGFVTTDFDGDDDQARGVVVLGSGKIVAGGWARVDDDYDFALVGYCANGDLDNGVNCGAGGFGSGGKVTTGFGYDDRGYALALQSDDKIVAAGQSIGNPGSDFALARYCPDGSLDDGDCGGDSFDGDGKVKTLLTSIDGARAVTIQADGKIVAAGLTGVYPGNASDFGLVRYCANGSRDDGSNCGAGGFGSDGKVITNITGGDNAEARGVAARPDGTLMAVGYANSILGFVFVAVNYAPNGTASSPQVFDLGQGGDRAEAVVAQPDGRVVAAGRSANGANDDLALIRLWPDGALDAGGRQTLGFDDPLFGPRSREVAHALAVQADGKLVLAGQIADAGASDTDFALARFWPDGGLDHAFGAGGRVTYGLGGDQSARAVGIQPDGKIVVAGITSAVNGVNLMIARFNANGTPDGGFGFGGFYVLDFLGGPDYGLALAFAPDRKIVVGGTAFNGARNVFGVARFGEDGFPDSTFDEDGKTLYEFAVGPNHWGTAVVVQADRKIVLGGHVGADFALVRLTEAGLVDYSFGTLGQTVADLGGADYLNALLVTPGGWFVAAGSREIGGESDFALAQFNPNGVAPAPGPRQPWATAFVDWGGYEAAFALDWRADGQVVAAGCADDNFAWAQLPTNALLYTPIKGTTAFVGSGDCALEVKFTGWNKVVMGGYHNWGGEVNFALARFETTQGPAPRQLFLPMVGRDF